MAWQTKSGSWGEEHDFRPADSSSSLPAVRIGRQTGQMQSTGIPNRSAEDAARSDVYYVHLPGADFLYPSIAHPDMAVTVGHAHVAERHGTQYHPAPSEELRDMIRLFHTHGYPHHALFDKLEEEYPHLAPHLAEAHQEVYAKNSDS